MSHEPGKRKYELRRRAETMEATRQRITEAAVELHGSVGPARTTVTAVAERAGVQRHTVYRHFPTEADLYAACSALWAAADPWPDPAEWESIADPAERLQAGLDALYRYYERQEPMLDNVLRDAYALEAVRTQLEPYRAYLEHATRVLSAGWPARGARRRLVTAAVGHAVDFRTWESLVRGGGVSRAQALRLAAAMVASAAAPG
jgi:AcrR family transcriptional regulator